MNAMTDQGPTAHGDNSDEPEPWLDQLNPAIVAGRDASHFRTIIDANARLAAAERALLEAIRAARKDGDSWTVIAAALGLTQSQARERFKATDEEIATARPDVGPGRTPIQGARPNTPPSEAAPTPHIHHQHGSPEPGF
jgi:hypothetical protein